MNKNKIIFAILWVIVLILFISIFFILNSKSAKKNPSTQKWNFSIWVVWDDKAKFNEYITDFKTKAEKYKNNNFDIVSFPNYDEYYNSLVWAFLTGKAPDIFVLNNNDSSFFDLQVMWIDPSVISPDDFRKNYDSVFSNDLIRKTKVEEKDVEFLAGIPLWYETLGLFYNFREVKGKNLSTWSYINDVIREISTETGKSTIGIGNGSTVAMVEDIITQFLLLDGVENLASASGDKLKASLSNYFRFGDINMENKYDQFYEGLVTENKNNLDLFSRWDIQMVLGYPRLMEEIDKKWFNKTFLRAEPFPTYTKDSGKILVNYNYMVINKNNKDNELALEMMRYFASSEGQRKYLDIFPYYMPSMLTLVEKRLDENLKDGYSVKYKNFYNQNLELTTFPKGIRTLYDKEVSLILDKWVNGIDLFDILRKRLLCISNKMITAEGLETSCK